MTMLELPLAVPPEECVDSSVAGRPFKDVLPQMIEVAQTESNRLCGGQNDQMPLDLSYAYNCKSSWQDRKSVV